MVYLNWDRMLTITPENFGEDEKEELYQTVAWYTPTAEVNQKQLTALLKVTQEILKYKSEQVESLMSALDELASKQGEEVARGRQELIDEIEELREQLDYQKRLERDSGISDDEIRNEVVKLEMQNEELVLELQEREKDLVAEKNESERLIGQVARLEREKLELSRELMAFQEEANERQRHGVDFDSHDGSSDKMEELVETVRQKNKHIMHLLDDIEAVEQDNKMLQVKLASVRNDLTDSNTKVIATTEELTALKIKFDDASKTIYELQSKNKALISQLDEYIEKKSKNDRVLDDFAIKVNERVEDWKRLLEVKDSEIIKLKEALEKNKKNNWQERTDDPKESLQFMQQEQELEKLKNEVQKLSNDNCVLKEVIDELKNNTSTMVSNEEARQSVVELEKYIKDLTTRLRMAEDDSTQKAEEISELVRQLRAYENDEFGLSEAIEKIKKLEKKIQDRDHKIENLISMCNKLGIEKETLEDENDYLRELLELSPQRTIDPSFIKNKSESNAKTIRSLREEADLLQAEVMELKLTNRSLIKEKKEAHVVDSPKSEKVHDKKSIVSNEKYVYLVEENDALRKGMHEILESLRKETMGEVEISSLERLLEALDSRHVSGWYHPAMRLQAQLNSVQGECQELRKQVGALKKENITLNCQIETNKFALEDEEHESKKEIPSNENDKKQPEVNFEKEKRIVDLETLVDQCRLNFDKAKDDWSRERRQLVKEKETFLAELSKNIDSGDVRDTLTTAINFVHLQEESLENELNKLRKYILEKEEDTISKITLLKGEKLNLQLMVTNLNSQLNASVPFEKIVELERELADLKFSYSQVLNFNMTKEEKYDTHKKIEDFSEAEALLDEIKSLKEKILISETQLNCYENNIVTQDLFSNELTNLANKLATAETELSCEKIKKHDLEKFCESLKDEQMRNKSQITLLTQEIEERNKNINEMQNALLSIEKNIEKQTIFNYTEQYMNELQTKYEILILEKNKVEELLEICRKHIKSDESYKVNQEVSSVLTKELISALQNSGNEKMAITKLTHELIDLKKRNEELRKLNVDLDMSISGLISENLQRDCKISQIHKDLSMMKEKHVSHLKVLFTLINGIRLASKDALSFPSISRARKIISELEEQSLLLSDSVLSNETREKDLITKECEIQIELEALHNLKSAFQSDPKNLINWHNKTTELRLKEARYKRQNQNLAEEVSRMDGLLKRYKDEITNLEEKGVERERHWNLKLQEWEFSQMALLELVDKKLPILKVASSMPNESAVISELEKKVLLFEKVNLKLKEEIAQKEAVFKEKLADQLNKCKIQHTNKLAVIKKIENEEGGEVEKKALMETTSNLQAIINKKDETVIRYQELLKKSREEQSNATRRLQNELRNVHNVLANQSKAYSRLKHGKYHLSFNDIEKYLKKIQELEEELVESQGNLSRVDSELKSCEIEVSRWKKIAEERECNADDVRERMEIEIDRCREEAQNYQMEAEQLKELIEGGQTKMLIDTISDLQKKLSQYGKKNHSSPAKKGDIEDSENAITKETLSRQLKSSQEECSRVREQLKSLRAIKSRPSTAHQRGNSENLVDKIRKLEESLQLSKQHEKELGEMESKRLRSVEEVARWDERKKYQKTVEKLQNKLKEKDVEVTIALNKLDTMRGLMTKIEKEKSSLEKHLRNLSESARESRQIEKLIFEKAELATQVASLEEELAYLKLNEEGKEREVLQAKLEKQEKTINELQISKKEGKSIIREREKRLLETENISIKESLEKLKEENKQLRDSYFRLENELKLIKAQRQSSSHIRTSYDLQREISKIKTDLKSARDRLSITVQRNTELEEEIQQLRKKLNLWEEKDLSETLTKQRLVTELNQELMDVKCQLTHKVHLLDRVKILLKKAATKEKALNDKVYALQTMVPDTCGSIGTQNNGLL